MKKKKNLRNTKRKRRSGECSLLKLMNRNQKGNKGHPNDLSHIGR